MGDNFYESSLPIHRARKDATNNINEKMKLDENYKNLMNFGFDRRYAAYQNSINGDNMSVIAAAGSKTAFALELGKSQEEQLKDIQKLQKANRTGLLKYVPPNLAKYFDYVNSLRISPKISDLVQGCGFGFFFSFVIWANMSARSSFMYFVIGTLTSLSLLLSRNMPKQKTMPGMEKRKVANWSRNSFKTALGITLTTLSLSASIMSIVLYFIPISTANKFKAILVACTMITSFVNAHFEVFEEKSKNGWRWKKAMESTITPDLKDRLTNQFFGTIESGDKYDFAYNPQIDDYPPLPKYLDELEDKAITLSGGSGDIDEVESKEHYETWKEARKDARKLPVEFAPPETPWVGGKAGLYIKAPTWLANAYKQNVLKANAWRGKKAKFVKDVSEFELIDGPFGFRDKRPEWLNLFGDGVWEEKISVSRRAARAFGAYRKSMWKVDSEVKLQPCDGVELDDKNKKL